MPWKVDKIYGAAIGLQFAEGLLLVYFAYGIERTQDYLIVFRQLFYLVKCPQLITFFKWVRNSGKQNKQFHIGKIKETRFKNQEESSIFRWQKS